MLEVTHSAFLQALGYAIINSLWQFALLWLIYVSLHIFFKLSSHKKYTAGLVIQAAGFIWFSSTFIFYLHRFVQLDQIYFLQHKKFSFAQSPISTIPEKFFEGLMQTEMLLPYLSIAYLIILFSLCFKWVRAYKITQNIRTKGLHKIDINWRVFVKQLSAQLGIKREVGIYLSAVVKAPLTIGFIKPLILIPLASLNHLTTDQMEAVILHELAHIKRFDYLFNLFLALIDITLFFNPFAILISRHIKRERENCCDDWVLQYKYNAASYANALLQIAVFQSPSSLFALQAADNRYFLLNRIKRMIEKKETTFFNYRYQVMALFVMLSVVSSLAIISSRHHFNKPAAVSPLPTLAVARPTKKIANNPTFNPDLFTASKEKKGKLNEKKPAEKRPKKINYYNELPRTIEFSNTNNDISKQDIYTELLPAEVNPVSFTNADEIYTKNTEKDIEALNAGLAKVQFPAAEAKERELALAEDLLKELTRNLFKENKDLFDHKEVIAEIKAAFDKLRIVKTQLNAAADKRNFVLTALRNATMSQQKTRTQLVTCDLERLQSMTRELQLQAEKAEKQRKKLSKPYSPNNAIKPQTIFLPLWEQAHSFSFEFSTAPKVKAIAPQSFFKLKRDKKTDKIISSKEENKHLKFENRPPVLLNKLLEKGVRGERDLLIIRI